MLIKKSSDIQLQSNLKMLLYAEPGVGKTTLALSMPKPLLLDFDGGVSRVNFAHLDNADVVQVDSWKDINELWTLDLSAYETIIVDTAGKAIDFVIAHKCGNRQPQLRDWGAINNEFVAFMRQLSMSGKNIVYVCHRDSFKDGDNTVFMPALRAKSLAPIITELDLMGFVEMNNGQRTISFNPSERFIAKNTVNMPPRMVVPVIIDQAGNSTAPNDFLTTQVLVPFRNNLARKKEMQREYTEVINAIKADIDAITNAAEANAFIAKIGEYKVVGNSKAQAALLLRDKANALGLVLDKKSKLYV